MRLLITGAGGMLGQELQRAARRVTAGVDWRVAAFMREDLDVASQDKIFSAIAMVSPQVIVNCAAYTNVDGCEAETETAYRMNGEVPGVLAKASRETGTLLVHYSTDYVFDGRACTPYQEDHPVAPLSVSGRSKLAGEDAIRSGSEHHLILRTQWLYGRHGRNFVDTILEKAAAGVPLKVVNDQFGAATWARDLAVATLEAVALKLTGTFHAVNAGHCTWYDVALRAVTLAGMDPSLVTPTTTAEYPRPAHRPAWGVLDLSKLAEAGVVLRPWDEALEEYVTGERGASVDAEAEGKAEDKQE